MDILLVEFDFFGKKPFDYFIVFISGSAKQQYSNTNMICKWYIGQHLNTTMNQPTPDLA